MALGRRASCFIPVHAVLLSVENLQKQEDNFWVLTNSNWVFEFLTRVSRSWLILSSERRGQFGVWTFPCLLHESKRPIEGTFLLTVSPTTAKNYYFKNTKLLKKTTTSFLLTWVRQEYPLNLSILLSGGKENNRDSLSQRRAKRDQTRCRIGSYRALSCGMAGLWLVTDTVKFKRKANPAEHNPSCEYWAIGGESPFSRLSKASSTGYKRVVLLGNAVSSGRYVSAKVKYKMGRPIANK